MSESGSRRSPPTVCILAGGFGTRVRHLLPNLPKPMAPVAGRPFIEWVVRFFARHGCADFVLSTGYLSEVIEKHFAGQPVPRVRVTCRAERTPLGTAGGFLNCVGQPIAPDARWLVVNGDSLVFADPAPLLVSLDDVSVDAAILGLMLDDTARYGTLEVDAGNRLVAFREKKAGEGIINTGVYAFAANAIHSMPQPRTLSFELDVFPRLAETRRIVVARTSAAFLDIGTPASLAEAERFITLNQHEFLL